LKLLLDQNLSHKVIGAVADHFPGSTHVRDFGFDRADDATIWDFARNQGFTIVSKDDDFHQRSFLFGAPPKVIWLRVGNCSTSHVVNCMRAHIDQIKSFHADPTSSFLVLA
jgi:predicted nuclease of predicted toxin-antitoxin system